MQERTPDKTPARKKGLSRREFLIAAVSATAGVAADNKFGVVSRLTGDPGKPSQDAENRDLLVDPNKFRAFIERYQDISTELSGSTEKPIPYEVFLAVAMHESDSGTSELANEANNVFGVIAKDGWTGEIYHKRTEEEIPTSQVEVYREQNPDLEILYDNGDGTVRVRYTRPFRKYNSPDDSFRDFAEKLYFLNEDGSYRYSDVIEYLSAGGRDPYRVVELMSDEDTPGEAMWATGREWRDGVNSYIAQVQQITGISSVDVDPPLSVEEETLPESQEAINVDEIDFGELDQPRDAALVETMKESFRNMSMEKFRRFDQSGVTQYSQAARELLANDSYYHDNYRGDIDTSGSFYIVWHMWANGVDINEVDNPETIPSGTSHDATLSDAIESWKNRALDPVDPKVASCGYLLSDNSPEGELWQVTEGQFGATNHAGYGIQDEGVNTHPDVGNSNSVGIEVQANTIYDVSSLQFELLLYWTTKMLFDSGKLSQGMDRQEVNDIVNQVVIGHGKTNGLEFGYKYTRPMIQALQQFVFIAVQA